MAKPQRKCIFCEGANLSREHLWPQWASKYLPQFSKNSHQEKTYIYNSSINFHEPKNYQKTNGRLWTKKFKVVCKTCNETWMSQIEEKAKPILTPLITGEIYTITKDDCLTISQWITLKIMVAENNKNNSPSEIVTTQSQRSALKNSQKIPDNLWVVISRCGAPGYKTFYLRNAATIGLGPIVENRNKNTHCITLGIGELLLQVFHTTVDRWGIDYKNTPLITKIYPTLTEVSWPFKRALTEEEAFQFSMNFENMLKQTDTRTVY
jgi:hypothetical protein